MWLPSHTAGAGRPNLQVPQVLLTDCPDFCTQRLSLRTRLLLLCRRKAQPA